MAKIKDKVKEDNFENIQQQTLQLLERQTSQWDLAMKNYEGLKKAQKRLADMGNGEIVGVQFNPERIYSSAAKVDAKSIQERKCFLCSENLPEQQEKLPFGEDYLILVNPFPIFPKHLTIPHREHIPQSICGRMPSMLDLAKALPGFVVFYNGPRCGASAPDHFHFQAGNKGFMPIEQDFHTMPKKMIRQTPDLQIWAMEAYLRKCIVLQGDSKEAITEYFDKIMLLLESTSKEKEEPMLNILALHEEQQYRVFIFPRKLHRPKQFFAEGDEKIVLSPASVDFGGVLITPRKEDYEKLTPGIIADIFNQVTITSAQMQNLMQSIASV